MLKFWAVVKHEYKKIVGKWSFLIGTLLFPLIGLGFAFIPALIFSIKGEPVRIAIADQSGKISNRLKENLFSNEKENPANKSARESLDQMNEPQSEQVKQAAELMGGNFTLFDYDVAGKSYEQIKSELNNRVVEKQLDAYLIIPQNVGDGNAEYEFYSRKAGNIGAEKNLRDALNKAVRSQRLAEANISEERVQNLSKNINFQAKGIDEKGEEKDSDTAFIASFIIGLMIYMLLAIYGQQIMAAVVEEKETRIAEILFSSARPFELMLGKLVGVCLAGLTQLAIWISSALILMSVAAANMGASGMNIQLPTIPPVFIVYFFIFFLLGFFIYATIYALIGAVVTTVQEGGQFVIIPTLVLLIGFYMSFAIVRDPNSQFSKWSSIAPFFSPITMPVRILSETPPFWQILFAIVLNLLIIAFLVWIAAKIYRVGMLVYGKRATIPEILKWIRQS